MGAVAAPPDVASRVLHDLPGGAVCANVLLLFDHEIEGLAVRPDLGEGTHLVGAGETPWPLADWTPGLRDPREEADAAAPDAFGDLTPPDVPLGDVPGGH